MNQSLINTHDSARCSQRDSRQSAAQEFNGPVSRAIAVALVFLVAILGAATPARASTDPQVRPFTRCLQYADANPTLANTASAKPEKTDQPATGPVSLFSARAARPASAAHMPATPAQAGGTQPAWTLSVTGTMDVKQPELGFQLQVQAQLRL